MPEKNEKLTAITMDEKDAFDRVTKKKLTNSL